MKTSRLRLMMSLRAALGVAVAALLAGCETPKAQSLNNAPWVDASTGVGSLGNGVSVVVNSPRNIVLLPDGQLWIGRLRGTRDVMLIKDGQIMSATGVPDSIRQGCDVQISFEKDKIAYYFFGTLQGGSFERR